MSWILLSLFLLLTAGMVTWGFLQPGRLYEYPTVAGATWLCYIGPQAIGTVSNPMKIPNSVLEAHGIEVALLICLICAGSGWLGYSMSRRSDSARSLFQARICPQATSLQPLFWWSLVLYALGFWGAWKLSLLAGGFVEQFSGGGHYALEWRGAPVKYSFVSQLIYPAFALAFLVTLHRPSTAAWLITALLGLYPLATVVYLGRRSVTSFLVFSMLLALWFARRIPLPRWLFAALLPCALLAVVVGDDYRSAAQYGLRKDVLKQIDMRASLKEVLSGSRYAEFDYLVVGATAARTACNFGYGSGLYNSTVAQFVPAQLVGQQRKDSFYWRLTQDNITEQLYNWAPHYGSNPTGPLNAFTEFWYCGCLIYYGMARFFAWLWARAQRSLFHQCWYVLLAGMIPVSIYGSVNVLPGMVLHLLLFFGLVFWLCCGARPRGRSQSRFTKVIRCSGF